MKQREKTVPKKKEPKPKKPKKERTPKEATALMLGVVALVLAILAIASGYFLPASGAGRNRRRFPQPAGCHCGFEDAVGIFIFQKIGKMKSVRKRKSFCTLFWLVSQNFSKDLCRYFV